MLLLIKDEMDSVRSVIDSSVPADDYNNDCVLSSKEVKQVILH